MNSVKKAAITIKSHSERGSSICVISHIDADGLSAAGIMGIVLQRLDCYFTLRAVKQLDEKSIDDAIEEEAELYIFTDSGSGYLDLISRLAGADIIILDHHQPLEGPPLKIIHVNPHLVGIDGSNQISGSGVVYLVAREVNMENRGLASLAVIGALGDLQDRNEGRELIGLNRDIVEEAVSAGKLRTERDLIFYGRETKPIHRALSHMTEPFIPGFSGEEDKCLALLLSLGIKLKEDDRWRTLSDLTFEEKRELLSKLEARLILQGIPAETIPNLIGMVYTLIQEDKWTPLRDAREYSSLLNACGRMGKPGIGISICMGSRGETLEEAQRILSEYRQTLALCIDWLTSIPDKIEEKSKFFVVHGEEVIDDRIIGPVSTILATSGVLKKEKPILALALAEGDTIKVSARATESLVSRGLNLGKALQEAARKVSGIGGGHNIAAGGIIPRGREEEFLSLLDQLMTY